MVHNSQCKSRSTDRAICAPSEMDERPYRAVSAGDQGEKSGPPFAIVFPQGDRAAH
jgi:hypothetical protein